MATSSWAEWTLIRVEQASSCRAKQVGAAGFRREGGKQSANGPVLNLGDLE